MTRKIIKLVLFAIVLGFVGFAMAKQLRSVPWDSMTFHWHAVLGAALGLLGVAGVQLIGYRTMLGNYAERPDWSVMMAVAWVPPLGKYVPGKVAAIGWAIYLLRRCHVPAAVALSVVLALDGMAVTMGLMAGAPLLATPGVQRVLPYGWIICVAVVIAAIVILHPRIYTKIVNFALVKLGRQPLDHVPSLKQYIVPVSTAAMQWVFSGIALWCMANSFVHVPLAQLPLFISSAALAMTVSYLALFAPGGLAVREGVFMATLAPVIGAQTATLVAVAMRLLQLIQELVLASIGGLMLRKTEPLPDPIVTSPEVPRNLV
jgi:hypothetical protein